MNAEQAVRVLAALRNNLGNLNGGGLLSDAEHAAIDYFLTSPPAGVGECFCDRTGVGMRGVTCGDCPRDYKPSAPAEELPVIEDLRPAVFSHAEARDDGFHHAFYEVADLLGIPRPQSLTPKAVWETQMRPRLIALTAAAPPSEPPSAWSDPDGDATRIAETLTEPVGGPPSGGKRDGCPYCGVARPGHGLRVCCESGAAGDWPDGGGELPSPAEQGAREDDDARASALLAVARETGLRGLMHGVSSSQAREALVKFVNAVAPLAAGRVGVGEHVGDTAFESWFSEQSFSRIGTKQCMREAYWAGYRERDSLAGPVVAGEVEAVAWALAYKPEFAEPNDERPVRLTFDAPTNRSKEWSDAVFDARPLVYADTAKGA